VVNVTPAIIKKNIISDARRNLKTFKDVEAEYNHLLSLPIPASLLEKLNLESNRIYFWLITEDERTLLFQLLGQPRNQNTTISGDTELHIHYYFDAPCTLSAIERIPIPEDRQLGGCKIVERTYLSVVCDVKAKP